MTNEEKEYYEFLKEWNDMITSIILSPTDQKHLLDALEKPSRPNEKLKALMRGETYISPDCPPHVYKKNTTSGIGFCEICYTDDSDHPIHIKE